MKNEDFRAFGDQEIHSKIAELQESQLRNRFNKVLGNLEDTSVIKKNRRDIARLKTILSGLKTDDEGQQLASLSELCELLSLGTEESMGALSVDSIAPLLVQQLREENMFYWTGRDVWPGFQTCGGAFDFVANNIQSTL